MTELPTPSLVWIKTQDGSPTLWNNSLGEPYRSVKGAFSESLFVFVKPALDYIRSKNLAEISVGEFGLGAGTNWVFWCLAAHSLGIPFRYAAIEAHPIAFEEAKKKWNEEWEFIKKFLEETLQIKTHSLRFEDIQNPQIFNSIDDAVSSGIQFDVWFHDPFAFSLNADGYSAETLNKCKKLWKKNFFACSYACNKSFQNTLNSLEIPVVKSVDVGLATLKRERLEFGNF